MDLWKFCDLNRSKRCPEGCFWVRSGCRVDCTDKHVKIAEKRVLKTGWNDMSFFPVCEKWHVVYTKEKLPFSSIKRQVVWPISGQNNMSIITLTSCHSGLKTTCHFALWAKRHVVHRWQSYHFIQKKVTRRLALFDAKRHFVLCTRKKKNPKFFQKIINRFLTKFS